MRHPVALDLYDTPLHERTCGNCVHFSHFTQWHGACEVHDDETDTSEDWDDE